MRWQTSLVFGVLLASLSGCSLLPEERDGAPPVVLNPDEIADPIPHFEPISRAGNISPYTVRGVTYEVLPSPVGYREVGIASWYGTKFHGRNTSNGEVFNMYAMSAAHKTLPIPCYAQVTNLENGRTAIVRINDRGPFHPDRIIDLSYAAATKLGVITHGTARVEVVALDPRSLNDSGLAKPYYIQVAAFSERSRADAFAQELTNTLATAEVQVVNSSLFRVRVGPLRRYAEVEALQQKLAVMGYQQTLVLQ